LDFTAVVLSVGASLSWATTWVLMRAGVHEMSWVALGVLRPWMGLLFIVPFAWATDGFVFGSPLVVLVAAGGGLLNAFLGTALFYFALTHGSMHESNILANTSPFWGVVGSIAVLGEPARLVTFGGGALVIGGAYFLVRRTGAGVGRHRLRPRLAAIATGVIWGFSTAVPTKFCMAHGMSPIAYQFLFSCSAAALWTLAALPSLARHRLTFTRRGVWIALVSSFFGLFAGWVLWLMALQRADASALSPLKGLTLLFATILGATWLRESITRRVLVGGALVVAGVTLVSVFAS